jgi:hypothetical protein
MKVAYSSKVISSKRHPRDVSDVFLFIEVVNNLREGPLPRNDHRSFYVPVRGAVKGHLKGAVRFRLFMAERHSTGVVRGHYGHYEGRCLAERALNFLN